MLGISQCQVFITCLLLFVFLEIALVCILLVATILMFSYRAANPRAQTWSFSRLRRVYYASAFRLTAVAFVALILTGSFQIATRTGAQAITTLAWITVMLVCGGTLILVATRIHPLPQQPQQVQQRVMRSFAPWIEDYVYPDFRNFFLVLFLAKAVQGVATGVLYANDIPLYTILIVTLIVLLIAILIAQPYRNDFLWKFRMVLLVITIVQLILAAVYTVDDMTEIGKVSIATISMGLTALTVLLILLYVVKVISDKYRRRGTPDPEDESGEEPSQIEEGTDFESQESSNVVHVDS